MRRNLSHPVDAPLLVPKSLKRTSFCNLDNFSQSGQMQFLQPAQKNLCDPPKSVAKSLPTLFFTTLFPDRQLNGLLVTRILLQKIYFYIFSASIRKIIAQWKIIFSKSCHGTLQGKMYFYIFSAPPPSYTPITLIALSEQMFTTDALAQEQQKVLSLNMRNVCHESRFSTGWTLKGQ